MVSVVDTSGQPVCSAQVAIAAPGYGTDVVQDSIYMGRCVYVGRVEAGIHSVTVTAAGYKTQTIDVQVDEGPCCPNDAAANVTLQPG
jgi:hypothetical protein